MCNPACVCVRVCVCVCVRARVCVHACCVWVRICLAAAGVDGPEPAELTALLVRLR